MIGWWLVSRLWGDPGVLAKFSHELLDGLVKFGELFLPISNVGIQRPGGIGAIFIHLGTDETKDGIELP